MDGFIPFLYLKYFLFLNKKRWSKDMEENKQNIEMNKQALESFVELGELFNKTFDSLTKLALALEKQQIEELKKANDPSNGFFGIFKIMHGG